MWGQLLRWVNIWGQGSPIEPIFFLPNVYYPAELSEEAENRWCEQFLLDKAPGALILRSDENGFLMVSAVLPQQEIKHYASKEISVKNKSFYYKGSQIATLGELTQALHAECPDFELSVRYWLVPELEVSRIFREQAQLFRPDEMGSAGADSIKINKFYQCFGLIKVFCLPGVFYPRSFDGEMPASWIHAYLKDQEVGACLLNPSADNKLVIHFVDNKDHLSNDIKVSRIESNQLHIKARGVWKGNILIRTMQELIGSLHREFPDMDLCRSLHLVSEFDARRVRFSLGIEHLCSYPEFLSDEEIQGYLDKVRILSAHLDQEGYCLLKGAPIEEPRLALDGFSYEKDKIIEWFESSQLSPATEYFLPNTTLRENWMLKDILIFFGRVKPVLDRALETSRIQYAQARSRFDQSNPFSDMMSSIRDLNINPRNCISKFFDSSEEKDLVADLQKICLELESMGQCAIRYARIEIPGTLETGHTFEKKEIQAWLDKNLICPQTAKALQDKSVWDNHTLLGPLRVLNELEELLPNLCLLLKNLRSILSDDHAVPLACIGNILFPNLPCIKPSFLPFYGKSSIRSPFLENLMHHPQLLITYPSHPAGAQESDVEMDGAGLAFSVESSSPKNSL